MGELIAFKSPPTTTRPWRGPKQPGAIVFFTGVRREILREPVSPSQRPDAASEDGGKPSGKSRR